MSLEPWAGKGDVIAYLTEKGLRWQKGAKYVIRAFTKFLTNEIPEFQGIAPAQVDARRITVNMVLAYRDHLENLYQSAKIVRGTFRLHIQSFRRWFAFLFRSGHILRDPAIYLEPVSGRDPVKDRALSPVSSTSGANSGRPVFRRFVIISFHISTI